MTFSCCLKVIVEQNENPFIIYIKILCFSTNWDYVCRFTKINLLCLNSIEYDVPTHDNHFKDNQVRKINDMFPRNMLVSNESCYTIVKTYLFD